MTKSVQILSFLQKLWPEITVLFLFSRKINNYIPFNGHRVEADNDRTKSLLHFSHISAKLSITSYKVQIEIDKNKLTQPFLSANQQPITDIVNRLWSYLSKSCRFCPTLTFIPGGGWTVCTKCSIQRVTSVYCHRLSAKI